MSSTHARENLSCNDRIRYRAFLSYLSFFVSFWFREFGHILYGFLNNLLFRGTISRITVTSWVDFPPYPFLKAPQQVTIVDGDPSLNFAVGGILFVILVWVAISLAVCRTSRDSHRTWVFAVPLVFSLMEILGNFLCGTDNLSGVSSSTSLSGSASYLSLTVSTRGESAGRTAAFPDGPARTLLYSYFHPACTRS